MFRLINSIVFCTVIQFSLGQYNCSQGARSGSLANASVAISDGWSYYSNPGALGAMDKVIAGLAYENRFLLKELQAQALVYIQPVKMGVLSFGAQFSGFEACRTVKFGLGYSLKLSDYLFAGVQLNYQSFRFASSYGYRNCITAETGLYTKVSEDWNIGISIFNISRTFISRSIEERLPTVMRIGSTYHFTSLIFAVFEAEKNINYPMRLKSGIEYKPVSKFSCRIGAASQPVELTCGFGYLFSNFQLDFGSAYNQLIGWSPHFSITYKPDR